MTSPELHVTIVEFDDWDDTIRDRLVERELVPMADTPGRSRVLPFPERPAMQVGIAAASSTEAEVRIDAALFGCGERMCGVAILSDAKAIA